MDAGREVELRSGSDRLRATEMIPSNAFGVVVFAHGSGSGRASPRNRFVAGALYRARIGAVLLDLLTEAEAVEDERTASHRFQIPFLARRLIGAVDSVRAKPEGRTTPLGIFGASTGGAAALIAAAERPDAVRALVLRGARSDLADEVAGAVAAPTLFIVGALDPAIAAANRTTARRLLGPHTISVVEGAGHLFEEPGALETVAERSVGWFSTHFGAASKSPR
jgi:putative phosphoribosyl transferase